MEWFYWVIAVCPLGVGGGLGMLLDIKYDFGNRGFYWLLGALSTMPAVAVAGVAL